MIRLAQRFTLILLTAVLLITTVACTPEFTLPNADPFAVTLTPLPTEDISTPTPVPGGAAEIGQTFYQAWAKGDIIGMYSLLSPQSQALVDNNTFVTQYETAMRTATVEAIRIQPLAASQEGARGSFQVQVIWDTAVLGPIERTHSVDLAFANGRWGVIWHEGLILPELTGGHKLVLDYKAPSRGNIYDVNGKALAYQGSSILLGVVPGRIEDEAGLLATISPLLNLTPEQIQEKYAAAQADWYVELIIQHYPPAERSIEKHEYYEWRLRKAIELEPNWFRYFWFLGYRLYCDGRMDEAQQHLRYCFESQSDLFPVEVLNSGMVLVAMLSAQSKYVEALELLNKAQAFFQHKKNDFEVKVNFRIESWYHDAKQLLENDTAVLPYDFAY